MEKETTILIVEDEPVNRRILKKILSEDYHILEAENGSEAWEILRDEAVSTDIGAVLTDIVMPEMDGYALLEKMQQAAMTELPVIVLTGDAGAQSEQKALEAGAWDFVPKPYNAKVLQSRLHNALGRRQAAVYKRMQRMAMHDPLTGLRNRSYLFKQTREMLDAHPDVKFALYRCDIDHFALYNTAFGEAAGDELLCFLADILRKIAARFPLCSYGRVSADVFCSCVPYTGDDKILQSIVEEIQQSLAEYRKDYLLEISVGVNVIEDRTLSVEEYFVRATMGAQKCKRQYGKHIGFYDDTMRQTAASEQSITNEMENALQERQFVVYLQPKVALETEHAAGAEALVRWQHPTRGLVSPGLFIPVFEKNGFIAKLDYYVWDATCKMLRDWVDAGCDPDPVSVNISRISLYNPALVEDLKQLVEKHGIDIALLQLEITESAYMTDPDLMQNTIHDLHEAGFTILMDDFGSGYSSLNTLKEIDVDILKIDMKFLQMKRSTERGEIILASMIKMANWLGMPVVVEGVETKAQHDFLEGVGSTYIQGYYYARPMPQAEYEEKFVRHIADFSAVRGQNAAAGANTDILIIDDSEMDRALLTKYLEERFTVTCCACVEEALLFLQRSKAHVRLILVDNIMDGMDGMDFLTYCQDHPTLRMIPQIMITANDSPAAQVKAFKHGAFDYIAKPLYKEVVLSRVNHVMEISRLYRTFESAEYSFRSEADRDSFTGLLTKNAFVSLSARLMENDKENDMALLVFDFDNFKAINDSYGHKTGDAVIKTLARVIKKAFRKSDLVGRFGGDEFTVLMTNLPDPEIVRRKGEEILKTVAVACSASQKLNGSVSVGVAFREAGDDYDSLFARADQALYEAKEAGKARVVVYGESVPQVADDDKPLVLVCGEDAQLYPAIALAYGDGAAFANITSMQELHEAFAKYGSRVRAICMDTQKQVMADADAFYQYILAQGGGSKIPLLAVCREADLKAMRAALTLQIQDILFLPPQPDVLQRKLSRAILGGCTTEG